MATLIASQLTRNSLSAHDGFNSSRTNPRDRAANRTVSSSNSIAARLNFAHIVLGAIG